MTTQRYRHLSPATIDHPIRLLEAAAPAAHGDVVVETQNDEKTNSSG